jgi:hypothetical protein
MDRRAAIMNDERLRRARQFVVFIHREANMKRYATAVVCGVGLIVILVLTSVSPGRAANVTKLAFTVPLTATHPTQYGAPMPSAPSGTGYAISSVTVANPSMNEGYFTLRSFPSQATQDCSTLTLGFENDVVGPQVYVPPFSTIHITFPQPHIMPPQTAGAAVCLGANGVSFSDDITWSAVGEILLK